MGIPSFYKHLLQTVGGLISKSRNARTQVFALDLNCAIYHCARKAGMPQYTHDTRVAWEDRLIKEVIAYIRMMNDIVKPVETLYVAVDGVAPMAKIKQQRARRFKSLTNADEEARVKAEATKAEATKAEATKAEATKAEATKAEAGGRSHMGARWDTNAITPGTEFMARLATGLKGMRIPGVRILVSAADEQGEGEQKIMAWVRQQNAELKDVVVYGLDADLIILSILEHARSGRCVDLFREVTEFGGGTKVDALGKEEFLYMDVEHLSSVLYENWGAGKARSQFLTDFVGIMNLLGNDFVPHGMGLKINDEGIEQALQDLNRINGPLVIGDQYEPTVLAKLLESLSRVEERNMIRGIRKKLDARVGASNSKDPEARALALLNDRPVIWAAEKCLVEERMREGYERPRWEFRADWRTTYARKALWDAHPDLVISAYCKTLAWTLKYYIGTPVDMCWYYPWFLPPLMADVAHAIRQNSTLLRAPEPSGHVLKPIEQLAMVLPTTSFCLLPVEYRCLPDRHPYAWPTSWSVFSLGRRFLWECEPLIPLVQPQQIRTWMEECLD
jgi:5'-3' exoribonuclease 1